MNAICIGHATYDVTLPMNNFPEENIKYRINNHVECIGGPASNGAYLLAKWGINTAIASVIGKDYYGDRIISDFKKIGANIKYLEQNNTHETSSSYIIANMSNGSRTVLTAKKSPIRKLAQQIREKFDVILIDGEHPETAHEVLDNNPEAISILDAGRLNNDTLALGKKVSYVICSKEFAEKFSKKKIEDYKNIELLVEIYQKLKLYFNTNVIITLEAIGSFTCLNHIYKIIPSIKVKPLDSTGAGDIFHGAFAYFIGKGENLEETIKLSSIAAAISVTRIGSRYSIPELKEVLEYDILI